MTTDASGSPRRPGASVARLGACSATLLLFACAEPAPSPLRPSTAKGHQEVVVIDGRPAPLLFDLERRFGLCYATDPTTDTSTWKLSMLFDGLEAREGPRAASERSEAVLCFKGTPPAEWAERLKQAEPAPEAGPDAVRSRICGRLIDDYAERTVDAGCVDVYVRPADEYAELRERRNELVRDAWNEPLDEVLPRLDTLTDELNRRRFPQLAINVELTALHFLARDGSPESLDEARRRLADLPPWLGRPFTEHLAAGVLYQRAVFLLHHEGHPGAAWAAFKQAEALYTRAARPRLTATHAMAQIVAGTGAVAEAQDRLRAALDECEPTVEDDDRRRCNSVLEANARGTLAWLTLRDGTAREPRLRTAEAFLEESLASTDLRDPLEIANRRLDLAYLHLRLGEDPAPALEAAAELLDEAAPDGNTDGNSESDDEGAAGERRDHLVRWRVLIEGLTAVRDRRPERAIERCSPLAAGDDPVIAAWASSCVARAERLRGRPDAAAEAFRRALDRHELMQAWQMGRRLPLGLDQRADDFARAARLEVEREDPAAAWNLLLRLDRLSITEAARRRCRQGELTTEERRRWQALDREIAEIYDTLRSFAGPASLELRRGREQLSAELKGRLRELWRQWPGCEAPDPATDRGLDYRAFAVDDEIVLLHRRPDGTVQTARRTPLERAELLRLLDRLDELTAASEEEVEDETAWLQAAEPLARALVPPSPLPRELHLALHGLLQAVPVVALPLDAPDPRTGSPWLGVASRVALQPAGAVARPDGGDADDEPALFVVDPTGNLTAAHRQSDEYERLFPRARVLKGAAADRDAVTARLSKARWIHFDTHGSFDANLPELSSLTLADGPLHWLELTGVEPRARFVNLSGCQTGRWPVTADSGAYGVAGLFTRLGAPWAVGSRVDLPDDVAGALNRAFYRAIHAGDPAPEAFRRGLEEVSKHFAAPRWAGLMLLKSAPSSPESGPLVKKSSTSRANTEPGDSLDREGALRRPPTTQGASDDHR